MPWDGTENIRQGCSGLINVASVPMPKLTTAMTAMAATMTHKCGDGFSERRASRTASTAMAKYPSTRQLKAATK